jgi:hypothetical protein
MNRSGRVGPEFVDEQHCGHARLLLVPRQELRERLYGRPLAWRTSSGWSSASALESHDRLASWPSGGVVREREAYSLRVLAQAVAWPVRTSSTTR